jgi:hypothetical protein
MGLPLLVPPSVNLSGTYPFPFTATSRPLRGFLDHPEVTDGGNQPPDPPPIHPGPSVPDGSSQGPARGHRAGLGGVPEWRVHLDRPSLIRVT